MEQTTISPSPQSTTVAGAPQPLRWRSWPARERPGVAVLIAVTVIAFGCAGGLFGGHRLVGVAAGLLLFGFLHRFWFPVDCSIDEEAVHVRTLLSPRSMPIASVRRVAHDGRAVLFSSRSRPSASDALRGLVLPLPAKGAAEITDAIRGRFARLGVIEPAEAP